MRELNIRPKAATLPGMRYFEDVSIGDRFHTGEHEVTAEEIMAFGRQYDPQPFHTDPVAAQGTLFGQLVASGWHTAAVSMQLMVRSDMELDGGVIGQGIEALRWPRPVLPGDRLRVEMKIEDKQPVPHRPERGVIKLRCRTLNQHGKIVQDMTANLVIARRPSAARPTEGKPA